VTDKVSGEDQGNSNEGVLKSPLDENVGVVQTGIPIKEQSGSQEAGQDSKPFLQPSKIRKVLKIPGVVWNYIKSADNNRVIAVATIVIALSAIAQYCEMRAGGQQTERIIATANQIKCALIVANKQNADAVKTTLAQNQGQFNSTLAQMKSQSKAMQDANDIQRHIAVWTNGYPSIALNWIQISPIPNTKKLRVHIDVKNVGATDAINLRIAPAIMFMKLLPSRSQLNFGTEVPMKEQKLPPSKLSADGKLNAFFSGNDSIVTTPSVKEGYDFYIIGRVTYRNIAGDPALPYIFCRSFNGTAVLQTIDAGKSYSTNDPFVDCTQEEAVQENKSPN